MSNKLLDHLNESLECAQNNKNALGATIESGLLELLTEEAEKCGSNVEVSITKAETKQLIDFIAESMKNHLHKLNGNTNRYRYSPYLMGLSMNLYLQSGPAAYERMRTDNVFVTL